MDENLERIGTAMMRAWQRVKKAETRMWGEWMTIGEGLMEGRRWAMGVAGTNRPEGKGYVIAFTEWLQRYRVDDMDKSDRAKLLQLMEERPAVEEWRASQLTDNERRSLNNPVIVWRKWTAATRVKKPKPRTANVSGTEHGRAQVLIEQLQARNSELEEELAAVRAAPAPEATPTKDEPLQFPQYRRSARGIQDITAKQIWDWLEKEFMQGRISPLSLQLIGRNAMHWSQQYWSKGGNERSKKPKPVAPPKPVAVAEFDESEPAVDLDVALKALTWKPTGELDGRPSFRAKAGCGYYEANAVIVSGGQRLYEARHSIDGKQRRIGDAQDADEAKALAQSDYEQGDADKRTNQATQPMRLNVGL
jgi:hypothetical protein